MLFEYAFAGSTSVANAPGATSMSFAPDLKRQPTYFSGELRQSVAFREAISALHAVVVSDLRYTPKDRTAYLEWAATREDIDWMEVEGQREEVAARIAVLRRELDEINVRSRER